MSLTGQLGTANSYLKNFQLAVAGGSSAPALVTVDFVPTDVPARQRPRLFAAHLHAGWSIEQSLTPEVITMDKWYEPVSQPIPPGPAAMRRLFTAIRGELGDVPRPDAIDPLPTFDPVWAPPICLPVRRGLDRRDRFFTTHYAELGLPPALAVETISVDKWYVQMALPPRRHRPLTHHPDYADAAGSLGLLENVTLDKYDTDWRYVVPRRRPTHNLPGGVAILWDEVFPPDPVSYTTVAWHTPLAEPTLPHRPRHFYPWLALVLVDALTAEDVHPNFLAMADRPPTGHKPRVRIDHKLQVELTQLAEPVHAEVLAGLCLPARRRHAAPWAMPTPPDPADAGAEPIHPDDLPAFGQPAILRVWSRQLWEAACTSTIIGANFAPSKVPLFVRGRLAAGFWRARY